MPASASLRSIRGIRHGRSQPYCIFYVHNVPGDGIRAQERDGHSLSSGHHRPRQDPYGPSSAGLAGVHVIRRKDAHGFGRQQACQAPCGNAAAKGERQSSTGCRIRTRHGRQHPIKETPISLVSLHEKCAVLDAGGPLSSRHESNREIVFLTWICARFETMAIADPEKVCRLPTNV